MSNAGQLATAKAVIQIHADPAEGLPIYLQIVNQVRYLVSSRQLKPGDELPPIRTLAHRLAVSPNTIVRAYDELEHGGLVCKRRGSGTYVNATLPELSGRAKRGILEHRIDRLLAEAVQLKVTTDEVVRYVRGRARTLRHDSDARELTRDSTGSSVT